MIECPKCHFVQPDDEYCASCGVNMKIYRQNHKSSQTLKNLIPYALTFCLLAVLIGFLILQFKNPKPVAQVNAVAQSSAPSQHSNHAKPDAYTATPASPREQEDQEVAEDKPTPATVHAEPVVVKAAVEEKKEEKFSIEAIDAFFLEVPKAAIRQLSQEGTVLNDSGSGVAIWIPTEEARLSVLQKGRPYTDQGYSQSLPSETSPLKILYQGGIKKDDEILFQMQVTPKTVDEKRVRLHVAGSMRWLVDEGDGKSSTSSSFDSTYAVSGPGQLILTGAIPQGRKPAKLTREVLDKTPLGILNSEMFHSKATEVMIVISVR